MPSFVVAGPEAERVDDAEVVESCDTGFGAGEVRPRGRVEWIVDEDGIGVRTGDCSVLGLVGTGGAGLRTVDVLEERRDVVDDTEGEREGRRGGRGSVFVEPFAYGGGNFRVIGCWFDGCVRTVCERRGRDGGVDDVPRGVGTGFSTFTQSGSLVGAKGLEGLAGLIA